MYSFFIILISVILAPHITPTLNKYFLAQELGLHAMLGII